MALRAEVSYIVGICCIFLKFASITQKVSIISSKLCLDNLGVIPRLVIGRSQVDSGRYPEMFRHRMLEVHQLMTESVSLGAQ